VKAEVREDVRDGRGRGPLSHVSTGINPTNKKKMDHTEKKPHHDFSALSLD